jgi:molecular chaperone GrpE
MTRTNTKSQPQEFDLEHELPAAEEGSEQAETADNRQVSVDNGLEKLRAERDTLLDRLARQQAEFENARKRAVREQQEFRDFAAADAMKALLPAIDSFERALKLGGERSEFRNGMELIYRQMQDALQKIGLRPIPAKGEPFDPHLHEAVEMVDTTEVKDNQVLDELQTGYKLKDRLLRPAMVRVARNSRH